MHPAPSPLLRHWLLDPRTVFLNHGSFGACPKTVLDQQSEWRARMERQPVQFMVRELEPALDFARAELARFVGADADDLAFVGNATTGVNTALRALEPTLRQGDELLFTDQGYNACGNALDALAHRTGARVVRAAIPFPLGSEDDVVEPVLAAVGERTRLAVLDHVTSPTGVVWPMARLVAELKARGIETLVDGAHAPGMLDLDLDALGAAFYTGNCHKWMCAPKGVAFLWVRRDLQALVRPLTISHGANSPRSDRSRFRLEADWTGTGDYTPALSLPAAIRDVGGMCRGGWPEVRRRNRELALSARQILCDALGIDPPTPPEMIGSLAAVPLPPGDPDAPPPRSPLYEDPLQERLLAEFGIEVPVPPWPRRPQRVLRVSAQLYNTADQYAYLARALVRLLQPGSAVS